jgi:phosphoserine phosphatase
MKPRSGMVEFLERLKQNDFHIILLTGGVGIMAQDFAKEYGIEKVISLGNVSLTKEGVKVSHCGDEAAAKVEKAFECIQEYNTNWEHCWSLCDGVNGLELAKKVGNAITFSNAKESMKEHSHQIITHFSEIIF